MSFHLSDGHILGLGSPLLDLSANVTEAFLHKYDLQPNDVIRPGERHRNLCHDMASNFKVELIAGGAVQNTIRVAQWFFHRPRSTVVLGAVGKDNFSQMMRNKAEQDRVLVSYLVDPELPTGTCACLITDQGRSRSLCAYLGASQQFSLQYMLDNIELMHRCRIVYTSGFFLTVCFEAQLMLARHVHSCTDKLFTFNLSAPFIAQRCSHELAQILPYVDILFGNEAETIAIAEAQGWKITKVAEIAQKLADLKCIRARTVVITQGSEDVLVAFTGQPSEFRRYPVHKLSEEQIVDTNGAGDAFVGGFLAYTALGMPLNSCIQAGIFAACEIIQMSGCTFPNENKLRV